MEHVITHFFMKGNFMERNNKYLHYNGFTLAEVLITLGIIGVVAAMTMPTLVEKHKEQVTVAKVIKFYSVVNQAILLAINDNGYLDEWDVPDGMTKNSAEKLMGYIKPYLSISKDCGIASGCLGYTDGVNNLIGGKGNNYDTDTAYYKIILNDGSYIWLRSSISSYCKSTDVGIEDTCGLIFTDINGGNPPNTVGKDIFNFYIIKNGLKGLPVSDWSDMAHNPNATGSYILIFGNMDYLNEL